MSDKNNTNPAKRHGSYYSFLAYETKAIKNAQREIFVIYLTRESSCPT